VRLGGEVFHLVKPRYRGGTTYVSQDRRRFLRVGSRADISDEYRTCRDLLRRGFPVAPVVTRGVLDDERAYFVEESIGTDTFGELFGAQTEQAGVVEDTCFALFTDVLGRYLRAQCAAAVAPADPALARVVLMDNAFRNHPPVPATADVAAAVGRATDRLAGHPRCPSQSDLNPFNVLPAGVIDFELAVPAPLGFDVVTSVFFGHYWPAGRKAYEITAGQTRRFLATMDDVAVDGGMPPVTRFLQDFLLMKAVWATAKDDFAERRPGFDADLWRWRVELRDRCVGDYLAGRPIDPFGFSRVIGTT
jgi:hypothetical protein